MGSDGLMEDVTMDINNALHFPIGNVNPIYIDASNLSRTNERVSNVKYQSFNNNTMFFIDAKSSKIKGESQRVLDYKSNFLTKVKDADSNLLSSSAKNAYENDILPDFNATKFWLQDGTTHRVEAGGKTYTYQRTVNGIHGQNTFFPDCAKENSNSFYVETPSFVLVNGKYHSLYGHPIFYAQNEIADSKERTIAKAYLFLWVFQYDMLATGNVTLLLCRKLCYSKRALSGTGSRKSLKTSPITTLIRSILI